MEGGKAEATIITKGLEHLLGDGAEDVVESAAKKEAERIGEHAGEKAAQDAEEKAAQDAERKAGGPLKDGPENKDPQATTTTKDPIDVATGQVLFTETDVSLPGVLPLVIERMHRSSYRQGGLYGISWASTLDQRLEITADAIRYAAPNGTIRTYPQAFSSGMPMPPMTGPVRPLTWLGNDGYIIDDPQSGQRMHFPALGGVYGSRLPISAISDRNGNRITFHRDHAGLLTEIRHSGGYRIAVDTDGVAGRARVRALRLLTPQDDENGRDGDGGQGIVIVRYGYDAAGNLTEVINSSGLPLRFGYDDAGRMTGWRDRNDHEYHYDYDDQGRAVRGHGIGGYLNVSLAYEPTSTVLTDSLGHRTTYHLNERRQVIAETNPLGHTTTSEWDERDQLVARTDPLGHTTRYTYDLYGNCTQLERPDGLRMTTVYGDLNVPVTATEVDGTVWRQRLDERGNVVATTDPLGATTTFEYGELGNLSSVTGPLGGTVRIESDAHGLPIAVTDPHGSTTKLVRDVFGRVTRVIDAFGAVVQVVYTIEGKPVRRVLPDGSTERWAYDNEGNVVEHVDAAGHVTRSTVTCFDLPSVHIEPDGARLEYSYDTELRLTSVTNAAGLRWRYEYDAAGNLTTETDFNDRVLSYVYDIAGRLIERTNGAGETTRYDHDPLGNIIKKSSGSAITTFSYDACGRLLRAVNDDADLRYERDPVGRVLAEICNGRRLEFGYDLLGRRVGRRTPSGAESTWEYDTSGRPVALRTAGQMMRFEYDSAGREINRFLGSTLAFTQQWDVANRLTGQGIWNAHVSGGQAVPRPRLVQHRSYAYRADGYLVGVHDGTAGTRRLELDTVGRVTAVHGAGWSERYGYDLAGNLTYAEWPAVRQAASWSVDAMGEREYAGMLIDRAGWVRYGHDRQGRVVFRQHRLPSSEPLTWRFEWDADDHLTAVITPDGRRWRYRYDALGRRIAKQLLSSGGDHVLEQVDFVWDGLVLAEQAYSVRSSDGGYSVRATSWEWEPEGFRPLSQTERVPSKDLPQEWVDQQFYAISTDLIGTPTELIDSVGNVGWRLRASLWGSEVVGEHPNAYCPIRFPGHYFDPESGLNYNYHRYFDPSIARYLSLDPIGLDGGPNPGIYVANPLHWVDILGLAGCDPRNQPGTASGSKGIPDVKGRWLRGSHGNAGRMPGQIARQLEGQTFKNWKEFREAFWTAVSKDPHLAGQFRASNVTRMAGGHAPFVAKNQWLGKASHYVLHHVTPIQHGGGVYDLGNIVVVTPRYHKFILDGTFHFG